MSTYKVIKTFKNGETNTVDNLSVRELQGLIKADTDKWFDDIKEGITFYTQYDFRDFTVTVAEKESLYKQLRAIITKNNAIYNDLCDEIFEVESNVNKSTETVEHTKRKRWQFMHDYATELSTFIWDHITELQARDLSVFDMVPSPVWNKMSEKNEIIVKAILDKYNEAKDGKANAK